MRDNWDLNATDFPAMLKKAFSDSYTLINQLKNGWYRELGGFTYYVDGEQVGEAETYQFGAEVTVKDKLAKEGYDFFGWSYYPEVEVNEEGKFTMPAANVTISGYFLQHCTVEASKDVYQLLDAEGNILYMDADSLYSERALPPAAA